MGRIEVMADQKITFKKTDPLYAPGETMVLADGDRIGFVRQTETGWHATDAELVGLRGVFKTRRNAAAALLKRWHKLMGTQ